MNKLTYERIADSVVSIDLHNGYSVIAIEIRNREHKSNETEQTTWDIQYYIKDNTVDILDLMETITTTATIDSICKNVHSIALKEVATFLAEGKLDRYVTRYDYMMKCFDRANDEFEEERLNALKK